MIVLYLGRRGSGKTLSAVRDAYKFSLSGWRVLSNMEGVSFISEVFQAEQVLDFADDESLRDCVLLIDELQTIIDSRRSAKGFNVRFNYFIQQIRKRNIIILATTQFFRRVDVGFREHCDVFAYPSMVELPSGSVVCRVHYVDATSQHMIRDGVAVFNASQVFPLYSTGEVIRTVNKK